MPFRFRSNKYFFFCFFLLLFCSNILFAQNNKDIRLNNFALSLERNIDDWKAGKLKSAATALGVLQFDHSLSSSEELFLQQNNIFTKEYLGENLYAAWVSNKSELSAAKGLIGISSFLPEYKIGNSIRLKAAQTKSVSILASFFEGVDRLSILNAISQNGGTIIAGNWEKRGLFKIVISSANLQSFAAFYGVKFISEPSQNIPLDLDSKGAQGATGIGLPSYLGGKGLTGKNIFIGHGDNCSGITHIDQTDRVINYNNGDASIHGVLVNGIIAGDGIMDPAGQGIAPDGTCISLFYDAVIFLKEELFKGFNATLTNNSYAAVVGDSSYSGLYDPLSITLDELAFKTPEQLDVFAAGNDGNLLSGSYPAGYYNVCGGYQTAKNILTIGSTSREYKIANSSGRGPLRDGRLKPEICAAGANIYCPRPTNTYFYERGTSIACPQTTGVLALLTERYKQLHSNANPKSDLLKAITINGASDLGRPGPDYWYGFGFLNASRSLSILENNRYTKSTFISGGAPQSFSITVPANTAQVKVLLYYHDPAASASSAKQLVNDLDLTVTEPGGAVHFPLILNPAIASVGNNAMEGVDRLNNVEQVTINNPAAGTHTITTAGFSIPKGPQDYVIAYDFVPNEIKLLFPLANIAAPANTDMYIYWDMPDDAVATTKVEFSSDNGASWTVIDAAVAANTRYLKWSVPTVNSNQCKIKVTNGSKVDVSGGFIIHQQSVVSLSSAQCPGSVSITWTSVPVVDKYYMLLKKGAHLEKVDSVTAGTLNYTFAGLNKNMEQYVSVLPAIGGMEGFRSKAVSRKPDDGTCFGTTHGDLTLDAILAPETGRRFTGSSLKSNTKIIVNVRNQDNLPVSNFDISYKVNGSSWKTVKGFSISANTNIEQVVDSFNFSDTIVYTITMAVQNNDRPDLVSSNDTIVKVVRNIPNSRLNLVADLLNDFETLPDITLLHDTTGLTKDGFWDFANSNDTGRLRTRIPGSKLVKTSRSISLDVNMNARTNVNFFTGTFNLSNYDTLADEVRFDFEYEMRGMPKLRDSNCVWVRGSELMPWIKVFTYSNVLDTSKLHESGTISLREAFRLNRQNFSPSTQFRFGQFDTTVIVDDNYGGGLTVDNIRLYKVSKDLQLKEVLSPEPSNCALASAPVIINIKNGTKAPMHSISLGYSIDGGIAVTEFYADTIQGDDNLIYTFSKGLSGLSLGQHNLKIWLHSSGDDLLKNDTVENYIFTISPLIATFPYLENFETGNGDWYVNGKNASWAYGTPNSTKIKNAASGTKAWKTNLNGPHNNNELSYLVSPCINTSGLSNPMLSFSAAFELERCAVICDRAYMEYSTDNEHSWQRLGNNGQGTNWYNNDVHNVWNGDESRWHVASLALPKASQLKLRFVMGSDLGTNLEGFALDDIHIFNLENKIIEVEKDSRYASEWNYISGSAIFYFTQSDQIIAALDPQGNDLGNLRAVVYGHDKLNDAPERQTFLPRSWVVEKGKNSESKSLLRLYLTDAEFNRLLADTTCKTCAKPQDVYRSGVTQYYEANGQNVDSSLGNNIGGRYTFYDYNKISWIPYDKGYYALFETMGLGEYWLSSGGVSNNLPLNTQYINLKARKINEERAELSWLCPIDTLMDKFEVQRSSDSINFSTVGQVASRKLVTENYAFNDDPKIAEDATVYYRLFCTAQNGNTFYSNTASVTWTKANRLIAVYPVPSANGDVTIRWTGAIGMSVPYSITDVSGRVLLTSNFVSTTWTNTNVLHLDYLAKGIYYLKLQIGENSYFEKLMFK